MAADEQDFRDWFAMWAREADLHPDPDHPDSKYDYRAAFRAGIVPTIDPKDNRYHWPSTWKADDHPNRFVKGIDTRVSNPDANYNTIVRDAYDEMVGSKRGFPE